MLQNHLIVPAARPSDLKVNNRMQILELFKSGSVYSVADLAREVGVSRQTVMKGIQFFLEKGLIVSDGKADSGSMGGKRAELFTLSADQFLFCMHICPDCASIVLMNFRRDIIDKQILQSITGLEVSAFVELVSKECERMAADRGIDMANVKGLCITTTGMVTEEGMLLCGPLSSSWGRNIPIGQMFSRRLGGDIRVITENLGKVCGSAYLHQQKATEERIATLLTYWDDISCCLIANGVIVNGKNDLVAEFGHMILCPEDDEVCSCGSRGCFERQVSVRRLRRLGSEMMERFPNSSLKHLLPDHLTIREIFAASARGDGLGQWLSGYAGGQFANALRNLALVFNPDRVVLQGDYANADGVFIDTLRRELAGFRMVLKDDPKTTPFALELDLRPLDDLTILGSYTLLIDHLFAEETTYA